MRTELSKIAANIIQNKTTVCKIASGIIVKPKGDCPSRSLITIINISLSRAMPIIKPSTRLITLIIRLSVAISADICFFSIPKMLYKPNSFFRFLSKKLLV